jgi:hypothetical protein
VKIFFHKKRWNSLLLKKQTKSRQPLPAAAQGALAANRQSLIIATGSATCVSSFHTKRSL